MGNTCTRLQGPTRSADEGQSSALLLEDVLIAVGVMSRISNVAKVVDAALNEKAKGRRGQRRQDAKAKEVRFRFASFIWMGSALVTLATSHMLKKRSGNRCCSSSVIDSKKQSGKFQ